MAESSSVALVTGASSGIGEATALILSRAGYTVGLVARRADKLAALASTIRSRGGQAFPITADLRNPDDIQRMAEQARLALGPIDVLINNAGVGQAHRAWQVGEETLHDLLDTNLLAPIRVVSAIAPAMVARRSGHIINIGSIAAHVASPEHSLYSASKAGLRAWSKALGRELRPFGVQVSLIAPGYIRTPMTTNVRFWPMAKPELIGKTALKLIQRPHREFAVPRYYMAATWLEWFVPGIVDRALKWVVPREK